MNIQSTQLRIQEFRQQVYQTLDRRGDTLFELIDALVLEPAARSPVELTLSPLFRRQWPSLYDALDGGHIRIAELGAVLLRFAPAQGFAPGYRAVALDHSGYPRPDAKTVADRVYHHQPTKVPGGKPVAIGHDYSFAVEVPDADGSWAVPLDVQRIVSAKTPVGVAVAQLRQLAAGSDRRVLALVDSEYIVPDFLDRTTRTSDDPSQARPLARTILGRLRPNRTLYRPPPPYAGFGRPCLDGAVFHPKKPETWGDPVQDIEVEDPDLGRVRLRVWTDLHFKKARAQTLTVICVQVLNAAGQPRYRQPLWLVWHGEPLPELRVVWRWYLRRFAVEHFLRYIKQSLLWTDAQLGAPEREELWTWVVCLAYWYLWLARALVLDQPRRWERSRGQNANARPLSPGRVRRVIGGLFAAIATPAAAPKRRGKSSGRPTGQCPGPRPRFAVVKKSRAARTAQR